MRRAPRWREWREDCFEKSWIKSNTILIRWRILKARLSMNVTLPTHDSDTHTTCSTFRFRLSCLPTNHTQLWISISFQRLSLLLDWEFVTAKITCADRSWEAEAPWWPFSSQKRARAWRPVKCIKSVNGIFRCAWPKASWAEENYTWAWIKAMCPCRLMGWKVMSNIEII